MREPSEQPIFLSSKGDVTLQSFEDAYSKLGIQKGDQLFLQTQLFGFGKLNKTLGIKRKQLLEGIIASLEHQIGQDGTLMMTTLSLRTLNSMKFDLSETPSEGGIVTEFFRKLPGVKRSAHPTHSFAVREPSDNFVHVDNSTFGLGSIYGKLYEQNATIILWGIDMYYCTFPHFIEECANVSYRKKEHVDVEITANGKSKVVPVEKYSKSDRYRIDFSRFEHLLLEKGALKMVNVGDSAIYAIKAKDMYDIGIAALKREEHFFLRVEPFAPYYWRKMKTGVKKIIGRG